MTHSTSNCRHEHRSPGRATPTESHRHRARAAGRRPRRRAHPDRRRSPHNATPACLWRRQSVPRGASPSAGVCAYAAIGQRTISAERAAHRTLSGHAARHSGIVQRGEHGDHIGAIRKAFDAERALARRPASCRRGSGIRGSVHPGRAVCDCIVVGGDHAALAGGHVLGGIEGIARAGNNGVSYFVFSWSW